MVWDICIHGVLTSTFNLATMASPWTVIVARQQTNGRGRVGRRFECGEGGLWLTAVLPAPLPQLRWQGFSLVVGEALLIALKSLGVAARLRWPNDIMIGSRKLAGILVEQARPETLCVGIGMNIENKPGKDDPTLRDTACRLSDYISATPEIVLPLLLDSLASEYTRFEREGLSGVIERLNEKWLCACVTLDFYDGTCLCGKFRGLDEHGHLIIEKEDGKKIIVEHPSVRRFVEKLEMPSNSNFWDYCSFKT